jgi:hypothetical protein
MLNCGSLHALIRRNLEGRVEEVWRKHEGPIKGNGKSDDTITVI